MQKAKTRPQRASPRPSFSLSLCLTLSLAASNVAWGGLPHWHRRARSTYPSSTYAPETRHYTVVDPVVVGIPKVSKHRLLTKVPPPGQVLWRQNVEAAPTYPWGWFGARRGVQNSEQRRYYGDARDWSILRGD